MADKEKGEEIIPRANDWEVVSLTASTYAAAPGPVPVELKNDDESKMVEDDEAETSKAVLMSRHFALSQSEHEKVVLEPESVEMSSISESKDMISDVCDDDGGLSKKKDDDNWDQFYKEENSLSFDEVKTKGETTFEGLNLIKMELSMYKSEATVHVEELIGHEQVEPAAGEIDLDISQMSISAEKDQNNGTEYPYEAWWKKHATALFAQATEANAFWSIFVTATVMGLVILGQHWQLERWQVLQLRWQFSVNNEMADKEKGEETIPRANDWEVVSLTASTYAAAPGPVPVELKNDDESKMVEDDEAETSKAVLMSRHFALSQSEHEKVVLEPESVEMSSISESKDMISDVCDDDGGLSKKKDDDNWDQFYKEENSLSFDEVKTKGETTFEGLNLIKMELSMYKSEATVHVEELIGHEQVEPAAGENDLDISQMSISAEKDQNNGTEYPYEAWWKKHATALFAQATEANAFWSIFVTATVMGLVILGQHWQLERWQVLQLRWQFSVNNEKMGWMLSPVSRLKDVIVGGNRRGFLTRSSTLADK